MSAEQQLSLQSSEKPWQVAPANFAVQDAVSADRHRLVLSGELDIAAASKLNHVVERICSTVVDALVLDLTNVTFLDCAGLRAILCAEALARLQDRCWFALIPGENRQVRRVLQLTVTLDRFPSEARAGGDTSIRQVATPGGAAPDRLAARAPHTRREPTVDGEQPCDDGEVGAEALVYELSRYRNALGRY
ncbi:MAG TPA: STAS domain-containing protein [Solirubrobacteraceae bacterium]|jgi:anti-anti-sigma factor|nr:STAS domain-containing protein [Solirubrobacteraceae bacterium]